MPDASSPHWRDIGAEPSPSAGAKAWQTNGTSTAPRAGRPSRLQWKRTIAFVSLVLLAVGLGLVVYWLRPIKPACLVLIGSGYESNLLLPHNAYGWNGLRTLAGEVATRDDGKEVFRLRFDPPGKMHQVGDGPVELKEQGWRELWEKIDVGSYPEKTLVVFVSLHGMADDKRAYLLPNVSGKQKKSLVQARVPLDEVLDSLRNVKNKKILLLLDVSQVEADWPIGMLHNDFVERLQEKYEKDIAAIENLVVMCSAAADQRSWGSDELQRSVFAHFVAGGLKGAGHHKGANVTALSLFNYVKTNVDAWVQTNRARMQTPILLGGDSRAQGIDLVHVEEPPARLEFETPALDLEPITAEWARWKDLKEKHAPEVHAPQVWRLYQDSLLRYEQLMRIGDPTGKAEDIRKGLDKLHGDLTASRSLAGAYPSLGNSFPMYRVLDYRPPADLRDAHLREILTALRQLDEANPDAVDAKKKLLAGFRDKSQREKQFLLTRFAHWILRDSLGQVDRDRARLRFIENELGVPERSAEAQLLKMLQDVDEKTDPAAIKLALDVRVLAEEAALSAGGDGSAEPYAEAIFPWIRGELDSADRLSREGLDDLFGDPEVQGPAARQKLDEARKSYEQILGKARKLQTAFAVRDQAAAELPYFAAWLAAAPPLSEQDKADLKTLRESVEELADNLNKLNKALDAEDRKTLPSMNLVTQVRDFNLKSIRDDFQNTCEKLRTLAGQQKNWHAIEAALTAPPPGGDVALRIELLRRQRDISSKLLKSSDLEGKTENEEPVDVRTKRQRDLLRACIKPVEDLRGAGEVSLDDKARDFFFKLPDDILLKTALAEKDGPDLTAAVNGCRILPGAFVDQLQDDAGKRVNPVDYQRRLRLGNLFCWLAERALEDHWFEPGVNRTERFYEFVGKAYLDSARGLFGDGQVPNAFAQKVDAVRNRFTPAQLRIAKVKELYWTTETNFAFEYRVHADEGLPQGVPTIWLEVTKGKVRERVGPRKAMTKWPDFRDDFKLDQKKFAGEGELFVHLHALYRGQHIVESAPALRSQPDAVVRHFPAPTQSSIAVRMDSTFDYGAISIVLDNSGSMRYRYPKVGDRDVNANRKVKEKRRYDYALDGLAHVLKRIPDNTELSLFTLGRKEGPAYVTGPTVYREPARWRQNKELRDLMHGLDDLPGDIASPIAETVIKSMDEGFPKGFKGPKVVLVLTDGDDNASFKELVAGGERTQLVIDELKRASERHPDVTVVVVCFIDRFAEAEEFKSAETQFKGVEYFKQRGQFLDVPEGDKLGTIIEDLLRPRLHLVFDDNVLEFPINYHNDRALSWKDVPPGDYKAYVPKSLSKTWVELNLLPPQKVMMVLSREDDRLLLQRGVLANQPETEQRGGVTKLRDGWLVSLLENENKGLMSSVLTELLVIEKKQSEEGRIRQLRPGFVWLELDAAGGKRPDSTLYWWQDWSVPAPAYRMEMRDWPAQVNPTVTTWFWPRERSDLLANEKLVTRVRRSVPPREPLSLDGADGPVIEAVEWDENHEVDTPSGQKVKKKCLMVRVRYPEGKPVWIDLDKRSPGIGSEHHFFTKARSCTAYFYGISQLDGDEANLLLLNLTAFKAAAQQASFSPDTRIEPSRLLVPEGR